MLFWQSADCLIVFSSLDIPSGVEDHCRKPTIFAEHWFDLFLLRELDAH